MKPARFDYLRTESLSEVHEALAAEGSDVSILAGGQSLVPLLSMRMARPKLLVDIMHLPELGQIAVADGAIRVGAAVRQAELLEWPELVLRQPLLSRALPFIGHAQTRARGPVCGSAALADPSAEIPLALVALQGEIELSSQSGHRRIAADVFFQGLMSTARRDDELIEAVRFPCRRPGQGFAFREFARRHGDFAIASAAALLEEDAGGKIKRASLTIGGVAVVPQRMRNVEKALVGQVASEEVFRAACEECRKIDAIADVHAPADYRQHLAAVLSRRALVAAHGRVGAKTGGHA